MNKLKPFEVRRFTEPLSFLFYIIEIVWTRNFGHVVRIQECLIE